MNICGNAGLRFVNNSLIEFFYIILFVQPAVINRKVQYIRDHFRSDNFIADLALNRYGLVIARGF